MPQLFDEPKGDFLALSGGGYRAMLFHVGALWRLNRAGYLRDVAGVSSVSGGSIVAGVLAKRWKDLEFERDGRVDESRFEDVIVRPIRELATTSIEASSLVFGLAWSYRRVFEEATLADLPARPYFMFNAANLQTGARWWFTRDFVGDWSIGLAHREQPGCGASLGDISLAEVVAASSAYPPFFAPVEIDQFSEGECEWTNPEDMRSELKPANRDCGISTHPEVLSSYREHVLLMDGGVVDNLGLDAIWQLCRRENQDELAVERGDWRCGEVFVSDGGGVDGPNRSPWTNWFSILRRTVGLMSNEPSSLRTETAIHQFRSRSLDSSSLAQPSAGAERPPGFGRVAGDGVYWNVQGTELPREAAEPLTPEEWCEVQALAREPTRLKALDECKIEWLINWGFRAAERSLTHLDRFRRFAEVERELPYPAARFGPGSATSEECRGRPIQCD
jgi:NTE family protein